MSGWLTSIVGALAVFGTAVHADWDEDLTKTFAYCAGRLSAEVQHAWLMGRSEAEHLEALRDATLALLGSIVDDPDTGTVLNLRILAKQAHSDLLRDATFHPQRHMAERARRLAELRISACTSFLLG